MTDAVDPDRDPPGGHGPSLDWLNLASLAWAGVFAVVTAVLAVMLR